MRKFVNNQPKLTFHRSSHDLSHDVRTTMSIGKLYPIDLVEVLPGDTFNESYNSLTRLSCSYIKPIMDDLYLDTYTFFVPLRLLQKDYESVFGAQGSWNDTNSNQFAHLTSGGTCTAGTVADYLGIPKGDIPIGTSILPFRAFAMIYDTKFRKEMYELPMYISKESTVSGIETINNLAWSTSNYTGKLPNVSRYPDLFTTSSVVPQRGPAIPLINGIVPVITSINTLVGPTDSENPLAFYEVNSDPMYSGPIGIDQSGELVGEDSPISGTQSLAPSNLMAKIEQTVNETRIQFQLQKMLERDLIYGTRYNEYLLGHYGVSNGDSRMQIPEFLSGSHVRLNTQQVAQTSYSDEEDYDLAGLAAYSQTFAQNEGKYVKSFTEHGYVMTVGCIRYKHSYTQGLAALWSRTKREHFYDNLFANLGNQPVYMEEIYSNGPSEVRKTVFGYNEAWSQYRTIPNRASGQFRDSTGLGALWTLADIYPNAPTPSGLYKETPTRFNSVITVPDTSQDQFMIHFHFNLLTARELPAYSQPGNIDH